MAALRLGESPQLPAGLRAVSRSKVRPVLQGCDGRVSDYSYPNGQVPSDELCGLTFAPGHHLRADAAVSLAMLNIAYRSRFGHDLCLTDSYRTLASQASLAARKPGLAARPGTSEHGMGLAVDFCGGVQTYRSQRYDWMRANAPTFGWANPEWAIPPSSREEPWHWEYVVGERKTAAA
jgi:zinc D-Ala-D-Ala carboxypeptidase